MDRFSELAFRRYEATIAAIVQQWPSALIFSPAPLSVETFSCRLRDAIKSHQTHQWPSKSVNLMKFIQIADDIVVSTTANPGKITVAPATYFAKCKQIDFTLEKAQAEPQTNVPHIRLENPTPDLIGAVILMHHYGIFSEPSMIKTPIDITHYSTTHNIEIAKDGEWYFIL